MHTLHSNVVTASSVREYFAEAFSSASRNQDVDMRQMTSAYVVDLLSAYSHVAALDQVSDDGRHHKPLAFIYAEALEAEGTQQRHQALRRLGDFALFIAGIFTDSLNRRAVDVDYYIGMGESAYCSLHDSLQLRRDRFARPELFDELAQKFTALVDVLAEVSEMSGLKSNSDVMRSYEIWLRTGSTRAHKQLQRSGIHPLTVRKTQPLH